MAAVQLFPAYAELIEYLLEKLSADDILTFRASDEAQARARTLLEKNNAGTLTEGESAELDQMLQVERLVGVLKAKALAAKKAS